MWRDEMLFLFFLFLCGMKCKLGLSTSWPYWWNKKKDEVSFILDIVNVGMSNFILSLQFYILFCQDLFGLHSL